MEYPSLTELIKDNIVYFNYYQDQKLYYHITLNDKKYRFAVPISDVGAGIMLPYDKAILFMRWIRKSIDDKVLEIC